MQRNNGFNDFSRVSGSLGFLAIPSGLVFAKVHRGSARRVIRHSSINQFLF